MNVKVSSIMEDPATFLDQRIDVIAENLPKDAKSLGVLDEVESIGKNRVMLRRIIQEALDKAISAEANVVPESVGKYPVHEYQGKAMCLVPAFRPAGHDEIHYVIGPLTDIHPLKLKQIKDRLQHVGGMFVWLFPYEVDKIEFEKLPPASAYGRSQGEVVTLSGRDISDNELESNW